MNIVILTRRYPFYKEKEFIDDELPFICKKFEKVVILTEMPGRELKWKVPENCEAYSIREGKINNSALIKAFLTMLTKKTINEVIFARKSLNIQSSASILKAIFVYYYFCNLYISSIKSLDYDVDKTIYYSYWLDEKAYSLSQLKKQKRIKYAVSRTHGYDCFIDRGYLPFRREIINEIDNIYSISATGKADIDNKLMPFTNRTESPIKVSYLGAYKRYPEMNPFLHKKNIITIVSCSNIVKLKRLDLIIEALKYIDRYNIQWYHFGSGEMEDTIKHYAFETLKDKTNVKYEFKGYTDNNTIQYFYSSQTVDIFLNCSDYEGIPVSVMEAFSYGIPAIGRNVGGMSELINDKNGFLLNTIITAKELSSTISRYASLSEEKIRSMRDESAKTFHEKFSAITNYDVLYNALENDVKRKGNH